jgi:AcrR family transcriptional regulator
MVATPWGTSELLRERMLRPGPGNRPEDVAQNQRERIFGAMVACVSERGYTATRVSDLVEISGVSSRTFYDLFADKQTCFMETLEAVFALGLEAAEAATGATRALSWEERLFGGFSTFAEIVAAQPAAARVCLIEAYAAGPEVLALLDDTGERFEALARQIDLESPERGNLPPELLTAYIWALLEVARNRLGDGTVAQLPGQMDEVSRFMMSYRPPPQPLRLSTRSPAARPEDLEAHSHAERALRALAVVIAERGYTQTTIDEVIARASMSATTFYANFSGKEDALMAAIDGAGAQIVAAMMPAFDRSADWPSGVRAAFGAMFSFLATRPALAHLMTVGVYGAGVPALKRRGRALAPLTALVEGGAPGRRFQLPGVGIEVIAGAVYGLMYRQVRQGGPEALPALAPFCTYLTLAPFLGAEEACAAANGDGRGRSTGSSDLPYRVVLSRMLAILNNENATPNDLAKQIGVPVEDMKYHLEQLALGGLVEIAEIRGAGDAAEPLYSSQTNWIEDSEWERMSPAERQAISRQIVRVITGELDRAVEGETFDARVDRHLSHTPVLVDEQGWSELMKIHLDTFRASLEVRDRAKERLQQSGKKGIRGRSVQIFFEVPEP